MNFNYSYRAFLVTSLLFGILFLTLWSIKLSAEIPKEITTTPVEYIETDPEFEEEPQLIAINNAEIETNRAYNEAEKFIRESEKERLENPLNQESSNDDLQEVQTTTSSATNAAIEAAKKRIAENKAKNNSQKDQSKKTNTNGYSRKTTISYNLKSRNAISLRNPVYTCESGGKIVINIEVDNYGNVIKTSFNKSASTSSNGCLIESAMEYAEAAQFSKSPVDSQKGSVTYNFPGQY